MSIIKTIKRRISDWVDRNIPTLVEIRECDARRIIMLYEIGANENDIVWSIKIEEAVRRLLSQMPLQGDCGCRLMEFLIYEEDRVALKRLCNNYGLWIADNYEFMPDWVQPLADKQYMDFTEIMVRI